ncbi:unnamed protein product [Cylindrotheca closterium]|uniref:Uncharacterized protein n=1 Tax=Cylindrotheca closterium TaxID=2856 RepID=A0AAD2FUI7_9STRA|nr:unnamed protein product [Cylindrotheca closterium]CAJ1953843.1 unnamed protein product [Cylindrotheca closterium]CAJ1953844.1 unnamed protein product [Cylindrotheca closterium]
MLMSNSKEDGHWYCSKECGGSDVLATHDVGVRQVATPTPTTTTTAATATTGIEATTATMSLQAKPEAATFDDIVIDQVAINRFTKARDRLTRLRSVAGVVIKDIPVDLLRKLVGVSRLNLGSPTEMKKADMKKGDYCEFIATTR